MKKHLLFSFIVICLSIVTYAQPAGWSYSKAFSVTNTSSQPLYNYGLAVTVNTQALIAQGRMQANGADIRFGAPCTGTKLFNYYIDSGINTASTYIVVQIDTLKPNTTRTIYMFYGNPTAAATSTYSALAGPFTIFNNQTFTSAYGSYNYSSTNDQQDGTYFQPNQQLLVVGLGALVPTSGARLLQLSSYVASVGTVLENKINNSVSGGTWSFVALDTPIILNTANEYAVTVMTPYIYGSPSYQQYYYTGIPPTTTATQVNVLGYAYGYPAVSSVLTTAPPYLYNSTNLEGFTDIKFYTLPSSNSYVSYIPDTAINASAGIDPINKLVCPGATVTFSAVAGGLAPTYQWQVNTGTGWTNVNNGGSYTGANLPTLSISNVTTNMNGYRYRTYMTSNCGTGYSGAATLNVNAAPPVTPTASITGQNPACIYTNATYNLNTNVNSGTYAWYVNGVNTGATGSQYSYNPSAGDQVYAVVTPPNNAALGCYTVPVAVSNAYTVSVGSNFVPIDSIAASGNNACSGSIVDFYSYTNVVGGAYQWMVNGQAVAGANTSTFSYAPNNGDQVTQVINTPQNGCYNLTTTTSQPVVMTTVYGVTPTIQVTGPTDANPAQQIILTANVVNYGTSYKILWSNTGVLFDSTFNVSYLNFTKTNAATDYISARIYPQSPANGTCYSPATSNIWKVGTTTWNTGVGNVAQSGGIKVSPNPFVNNLHLDGLSSGDRVVVYDMTGRKVSAELEATGDYQLEHLAAGHYIVHVTDADGKAKANIAVSKQ